MRLYCDHIALMAPFSCYVPKHHICFHLLRKQEYQGNPMIYATWLDEALNKTLKQSCKNAKPASFEQSVLLRMRDVLQKRFEP